MTSSKQLTTRNILRVKINYNNKILKKLRKDHGWTQVQVAQKTNISKDTIYNIEHGKCHSPQFNTLFALAELYQVPICHITNNQTQKHNINNLIERELNISPDQFFNILKSSDPTILKRKKFIQFGLLVNDKVINEIFDVHDELLNLN